MELDPKYDDYDFPTTAPTPQPGHPGHLTKEQEAAVFQLRTLLEQAGYTKRLDTLLLLRYLRARKFNVELSKKMWIASEEWRNEFGGNVDELVKSFDYHEKSDVFQYYPQFYHKTDKDGRPLYIEKLGKIDLTKLRTITSDERMLENLVVEYEKLADPRLPACSRKAGQLVETCCTIFDVKGVGMSNFTQVTGYLQRASGISQNHYPERLGKLYIINAPWGFTGIFALVKRFLDPVTVAKINVLGTGYQKELLAQIPKENLPSEFGGECKCTAGCELSDEGPWKDPEWAKPAKWETEKKDQSIPATESHVGEGTPMATGTTTAPAPAAIGETAPAAPPQ